jgi:hypothetical protein
MNYKNHPFFFPLLKKLIAVSINKSNTNVITRETKKEIQQLSNISWKYLDKIITKEIYISSSGQSSIGKPTLNKLVRCLPNEWGYGETWESFRTKVLEELVDKELIRDLPNKDYEHIFDSHIQKRTQKEVEHIAQKFLLKTHYISIPHPVINTRRKDNTKSNIPAEVQKNASYGARNLIKEGLLMKLLYIL